LPTLGAVPTDAQLGGLALQVFQVLAKYTAFPWPILQAQCERAGVKPETLSSKELNKVVSFLADGVARFSTPDKGEAVRRELKTLASEWGFSVERETPSRPPVKAESAASTITCPSCHEPGQTGQFCSNCGKSLVAESKCPSCGAAARGKFCSECGHPL
jgi:hypothetical protein